jgi:hypothetical protein
LHSWLNDTLPNIFGAFEKQLGLDLVKIREIPLQVIVVDHVGGLRVARARSGLAENGVPLLIAVLGAASHDFPGIRTFVL